MLTSLLCPPPPTIHLSQGLKTQQAFLLCFVAAGETEATLRGWILTENHV